MGCNLSCFVLIILYGFLLEDYRGFLNIIFEHHPLFFMNHFARNRLKAQKFAIFSPWILYCFSLIYE